MPNADMIMPRAPCETWGRTVSGATGARPRRILMRFTVRAMSGAVSASVPSRSKSTASITHGSHHVVDVHVAAQRIGLREGIVSHAGEVADREPRFAARARKLRRPDEARVLVGAARQQVENVFGAHDGEEERLRVAVEGGEEDHPAAACEARARLDRARRLGHGLE